MVSNSLQYVMVRSAVERGLAKIKESPAREIRNLVDLGKMFAKSRTQNTFFNTAQRMLEDENSAYYKLVEYIVRDTNTDMLTQFGMNLGYNSLIHGAKVIRGLEAKQGFNIPWALITMLRDGSPLTPQDVFSLVEQSRALGIYSHLLLVQPDYPYIREVYDIMRGARENAFLVFLPAAMVSESTADEILAAQNIGVFVDMPPEQPQVAKTAATILKSKGILCGGYAYHDGLTANEEEARKIATHAARVRADKVQLNTVSRPPAEEVAKAPPHRRLTELASLFGSNAEVICGFSGTMEEHEFLAGRARVLDLLQGGPKTLDDVAHLSGINRNETVKYLEALLNDGLVHSKVRQDIRYFYCESL